MFLLLDDVFHIKFQDEKTKKTQQIAGKESESRGTDIDANISKPIENSQKEEPEAFIFADGTFVTWGASETEIKDLTSELKKAEINACPEPESDTFDYVYTHDQGNTTSPHDTNDHNAVSESGTCGTVTSDKIIIGTEIPITQSKLAFSAGLSRSVKLSTLENQLEAHISRHKHIPYTLLQGRNPRYSRSQVLKVVSELFLLRAQLNFHSSLLDSPDFCWSSSKMEDLFDKISRNLDVRARIAVFNKKLDYANEVSDVLRNHLHESHSLMLEWCIVGLISVEILFEVVHYLEDAGYIELPKANRLK
jgi:uncharacterized Rmd1/YagE family protein